MLKQNFLIKLISNRIFIYLFSRYFSYIIQFLTAIYLAITLGPFYFGVYGFIILISNYLSFFNIGIPSSVSVMLIQNKTNDSIVKDILASSIFSVVIISFFLCAIGFLYYLLDYNIFPKFNISRYIPLIIIITVLTIFNSLFLGVYRFKNRLFEVGFYQSFKPIFIFKSINSKKKRVKNR